MFAIHFCTTLCAIALGSIAQAQPAFRAGDLYLISSNYSNPATIMRIDPLTQQSSLFPYTPGPGLSYTQISYDPYRDSLLVVESGLIVALDASGTRTEITAEASGIGVTAPTGDGRVYYEFNGTDVRFIDANGTPHVLMDQDGQTPYAHTLLDEMIWDEGTNSLFIGASNVTNQQNITRVTLNAEGTRVVDETSVQINISYSYELAVGFSCGPDGMLFLKIDTNSSQEEARMQLIDPATMELSTYATSRYGSVGGEIAGVYSPVNDAAVVYETFPRIREYSYGGSGGGTIWSTPGLPSSEVRMTVIGGELADCQADLTGDGILDNGDIGTFVSLFLAGNLAADFNGDGILDNGDIGAFITAFLAGC